MSRLNGHVDRVSPSGVVSGWITDRDTPDVPASAMLLLDGQPVAPVSAKSPRPDVLAAGHRPLVSGFDVAAPNRYLDGREHRIEFRAIDGAVVQLAGITTLLVERTVEGEAALTPDGSGLSGWAVDPAQPLRQLFVDVAVDGRHVATVACVRDAATKRPTSSGPLTVGGFKVDLAPFRKGGLGFDDVTVTVSGYGGTLTPEPLRMPRGDMLESGLGGFTGGSLTGWSLDPSARTPLPVKVYCDGELIAELAADEYHAHLATTRNVTQGGFVFELPRRLYDGVPHVISATGFGDLTLRPSPLTLNYEEQLLHQAIGALRVNNATVDAREYGFLARDISWLTLGAGAKVLGGSSRQIATSLTIDLVHHAAFGLEASQAFMLLRSLLDGNVINYDDAAVASVLSDLVRSLTTGQRAALVEILAKPEHRKRPFRAALMAAVQYAGGNPASGTAILFNICGRAKVSDAMVRFCAEMLVQEGLTEEARDLVFFSVVAKAA